MSTVTAQVPATFPLDQAHLTVTFTYDPTDDPYAVRATFPQDGHDDVTWIFARELLIHGAVSLAGVGIGDVHVRRVDLTRVLILLDAPGHPGGGKFAVVLPARDVVRFVFRTVAEVPRGKEQLDVDGLLAHLLEEAP